MTKLLTSGNKMLDRALARKTVNKPQESKTEPAKTKLSQEELDYYVNLLVEASAPEPMTKLELFMHKSGELTHQMLLDKYKNQQ